MFVGILQVLRFDFKKLRILEILNFQPWVQAVCKDSQQVTYTTWKERAKGNSLDLISLWTVFVFKMMCATNYRWYVNSLPTIVICW